MRPHTSSPPPFKNSPHALPRCSLCFAVLSSATLLYSINFYLLCFASRESFHCTHPRFHPTFGGPHLIGRDIPFRHHTLPAQTGPPCLRARSLRSTLLSSHPSNNQPLNLQALRLLCSTPHCVPLWLFSHSTTNTATMMMCLLGTTSRK